MEDGGLVMVGIEKVKLILIYKLINIKISIKTS